MSVASAPVPTQGLAAFTGLDATAPQRDGTIFTVASRVAAAYNSPELLNAKWKGVRLFINLTVVNGGTLTVKIQNFDPASQTWVDLPLAVTTALAAVAVTTLTVYPGQTETANQDISDPLGGRWRVVATTAVAAVTFGIGGEYLA